VVLLAASVAISEAAIVKRQENAKTPRLRKVVRRRQRNNRQGRQLFGNRVVLAAAPFPASVPAPIPARIPAPVAAPVIARAPVAAPVAAPVHAPALRFSPVPFQHQPVQSVPTHALRFSPVQIPQHQPIQVVHIPQQPAFAPIQPIQPVVQPQQPQQVEVRQQPVAVAQPVFTAPVTVAAEAPTPVSLAKPVAITRMVHNSPGMSVQSPNSWDYAFEAENGIKQSATGEMKLVGEEEVVVMRGSYEYIGADGLTYVVDWEADENGFRAAAPHLPKPVEIPFPEQQAAVTAQLRFAEAEALAAKRV